MAGMGIALISQHTIGLELGLGMMTTLAIEGFPLMRSWFVAHRRNMPLLPVHSRRRAFLLENGQAIIDDLDREHLRIGARATRGAERSHSRTRLKSRAARAEAAGSSPPERAMNPAVPATPWFGVRL